MITGPGMKPIMPIHGTPAKIPIIIRPEYRDAGNKIAQIRAAVAALHVYGEDS
jgi:hypothetical protein